MRAAEPAAGGGLSRRSLLILAAASLGFAGSVALVAANLGKENAAEAAVSRLKLEDIPFNGARAYDYLVKLCEIGPRPSASEGMLRQQKYLEEHFTRLGAKVEYQRFRAPHPVDNSAVEMANMIIRWHPETKERVLLCAHYDTLPFPMLDKQNPRGRFVGAHDNASGVSVLMELGNEMATLKLPYGVDFVMLDGEEFIFEQHHRFFLGSEYFARDYVKNPPAHRYRWGVLLDMIGDKDLQIYQERNSAWWKDTKPLVDHIWAVAKRLGVREFIPQKKYEMKDDHLMLHDVGKIPCIVLIDFDYPPWHTEDDTPAQCSPLSLAKVGWVVREWLKEAK
jgi:hypothetical protein